MDDLEDRVDSQGSFPDAERAVQAVISIKCSRQEAGPSNMSRRSSGATLSEGPSSDIGRDVLAFRTGASILFAGTPSNCRVAGRIPVHTRQMALQVQILYLPIDPARSPAE